MQTSFKFTKTAVAAVVCPPDKSKMRVRDTEVPSLALLVTTNGGRARFSGMSISMAKSIAPIAIP